MAGGKTGKCPEEIVAEQNSRHSITLEGCRF